MESDLEDFIAEDEEEESNEGTSQSEESVQKKRKKSRPSLLQQKFAEFEREFASDEEEVLSSVPSDEEFEEEEENDDDLVIKASDIDSSSDQGSQDGSDDGSLSSAERKRRVGKLLCSICGDYFNEDDFSGQQRREQSDKHRFCLRHTSTADFNKEYRKPDRLTRAVGVRLGPLSTSPGVKKPLTTSSASSSRHSPYSSRGQSKLDKFFGSGGVATGSAIKKMSLRKELAESPALGVAAPASTPLRSASNRTPHYGHTHSSATSSAESSGQKRNRVIVVDDDSDDEEWNVQTAKGGNKKSTSAFNNAVDSEEEWDEPISTPNAASSSRKELRHSPRIAKTKNVQKSKPQLNKKKEEWDDYISGDEEDSAESVLSDNSDSDSESEDDYKHKKRKPSRKENTKGKAGKREGRTASGKTPTARVTRSVVKAAKSYKEVDSDIDEEDAEAGLSDVSLPKKKARRDIQLDGSEEEWSESPQKSSSKGHVTATRGSGSKSKRDNARKESNSLPRDRGATSKTKQAFVVSDSDDEGEWDA